MTRVFIKRGWKILLAVMLVMVMVGGVMVALQPEPAVVEAAGAGFPITINSASIAANTTFSARQWTWDGNDKTTAEVWYSIDQGTTNTMTLYLDASPDNVMWKTAYATVVSANAADATSYTSATIVGRYFRIRATVANTNAVTPTIKVVYK